MKLLLVGRIGSGTTALKEKLAEKGMSPVRTYTTRPKNNEDENGHIFINESDIDNYPEKAIEMNFDGNTYFATKRQLEENDVIIVNPDSVAKIAKYHPKMAFAVIYVETDSSDTGMKVRQVNAHLDDETFEHLCEQEDEEFNRFEKLIESEECMETLPENIFIVTSISNDWTKLNEQATVLMNTFRYQRNLQVMIRDCVIHQALPIDENGDVTLSYMTEGSDEPSELTMSHDILACKLMTENCAPMLQYICSQYFGHHNLSFEE